MEPSPAQPESPAKVADKEVSPGSLSRFKALAKHLLGVGPAEYRTAAAKEEAERAKHRR